jgi:hypothetical protein
MSLKKGNKLFWLFEGFDINFVKFYLDLCGKIWYYIKKLKNKIKNIMVSSIGLGNFIATFVFAVLLLLSVVVFALLVYKKKYSLLVLSLSLLFNIISFLFFLGSASVIEYFNVIFWPTINLILIISYVYRKKK